MSIISKKVLTGFPRIFIVIGIAFLFIGLTDLSLWFVDSQFGDEKGVIFSEKLSTLITKINIVSFALLLVIVLVTEGQKLLQFLVANTDIKIFVIND